MRPLLLGDGGFPSLTWLLRPYPFSVNITPAERKFNKKLSSARVTVERGFGILKARWRCLLKRLDAQVENVSFTVVACIVMHNICQMNGDEYFDEDGLLEEIIERERGAARRRRQQNYALPNAVNLRHAMTTYIDENY